ncbi:hypothetical protein ELE22_23215, partial [Klebsiella pneumoniae]|nr:hypothetical protein [Klebsiella pneumoniae]
KIGPDPRNFNQRVSLGRNDLLIRTFQRSALSEKRITINRTWHYCRRAGFRQPTIYQSGLY